MLLSTSFMVKTQVGPHTLAKLNCVCFHSECRELEEIRLIHYSPVELFHS